VTLTSASLGAVRVLRCNRGTVVCVAAVRGGRIATGSHGTIAVTSLATGLHEGALVGHKGWMSALCPLTDGSNRLLSGDNGDYVIMLHDLDAAHGGASVSPLRRYPGHSACINAIVELSGGRFASGSDDMTVRIWALESGACLAALRGHTAWVWALAVADEHTLVSGGHDRVLRVWDTRTYAAVATIETPSEMQSLLRLADGTLASGHYDGVVRLWDWRRREAVGELRGHTYELLGLAQLPDGRLASASFDKTVRLWDVAARACVSVAQAPCSFTSCCAMPDGTLVAGCYAWCAIVFEFGWQRRSAAVVGWVAVRAAAYHGWE